MKYIPFAEGETLILKRVSMGWWLLRLSAKIFALLRLSVNFFQVRLTKFNSYQRKIKVLASSGDKMNPLWLLNEVNLLKNFII